MCTVFCPVFYHVCGVPSRVRCSIRCTGLYPVHGVPGAHRLGIMVRLRRYRCDFFSLYLSLSLSSGAGSRSFYPGCLGAARLPIWRPRTLRAVASLICGQGTFRDENGTHDQCEEREQGGTSLPAISPKAGTSALPNIGGSGGKSSMVGGFDLTELEEVQETDENN